jgi:hypothetical protein
MHTTYLPALRSNRVDAGANESLRCHPLWLWPNLLSLDAPLVAVAWSVLLAQSSRIAIEPAELAVLAATVWTIYAFDRLLDVRFDAPVTARHRFAYAHRTSFAVIGLAAVIVVGPLSVLALSLGTLERGAIVAASVAVYFLFVHLHRLRIVKLWIKQLAVAMLFAAGVVLPLRANAGLGFAWAAAAAVVWINIRAIDQWESAHTGSRTIALASFVIGAICFVLSSHGRFYGALSIGGFLIFGLNGLRRHLSGDMLRACVDLALFLPALAMLL